MTVFNLSCCIQYSSQRLKWKQIHKHLIRRRIYCLCIHTQIAQIHFMIFNPCVAEWTAEMREKKTTCNFFSMPFGHWGGLAGGGLAGGGLAGRQWSASFELDGFVYSVMLFSSSGTEHRQWNGTKLHGGRRSGRWIHHPVSKKPFPWSEGNLWSSTMARQ